MKENFWESLPRPYFILAPMEDVTDVVFRHVIAKAAPADVYFTEFTNSKAYANAEDGDTIRGRLIFTEDEQPIVGHIWGKDPVDFSNMAKGLKEMGFSGVDINMGCPADNVAYNGSGSGLIKTPEIAAQVIQAAKEGGLPVSVKTRLGYYKVSEYKAWISHLLRQDIVNLTVHLRTREEMSDYDAHWEIIPDLIKLRDELAPNTLLTINGDMANRKEGLNLVEKYGVDGVMIGRGVFDDPFAFELDNRQHGKEELMDLLNFHLDLYDEMVAKHPGLSKNINRLYKMYIKGFRGASKLRDQLTRSKDTREARQILREFEQKDE